MWPQDEHPSAEGKMAAFQEVQQKGTASSPASAKWRLFFQYGCSEAGPLWPDKIQKQYVMSFQEFWGDPSAPK